MWVMEKHFAENLRLAVTIARLCT